MRQNLSLLNGPITKMTALVSVIFIVGYFNSKAESESSQWPYCQDDSFSVCYIYCRIF